MAARLQLDQPLDALSGVELLELCRGEAVSPAVAELLHRVQAYVEEHHDESLATRLRLPETRARLRLLRRNTWLVRAAHTVAAPNGWQGCLELASTWSAFVGRGTFARLQSLPLRPATSSRDRQACLFHATLASGGKTLTASRLYQLDELRRVWGVEVGTRDTKESPIATPEVMS